MREAFQENTIIDSIERRKKIQQAEICSSRWLLWVEKGVGIQVFCDWSLDQLCNESADEVHRLGGNWMDCDSRSILDFFNLQADHDDRMFEFIRKGDKKQRQIDDVGRL